MSEERIELDARAEARLRAALLAAIRHAMEATCGYCPGESELEDAVQAGMDRYTRGGEG